jgi:hypothetical protein
LISSQKEGQEMSRRRFLLLATIIVLSLALWTGWAEEAKPALPERDRFLLLDSRIVAGAENAELVLGTVQKYEGNPLFEEDKPWEKRFDNLYANVLYDEEEELYKCWYSPFIVDESAKGMTLEERKEKKYRPPWTREMAICYATSKDGITWVKPELGLVEFEGSTANNILWRGSGEPSKNKDEVWGGPHGNGVFKDLRERDPNRRYKAVTKFGQLSVAFSADGIHWDPPIAIPEANSAGDTHNNALWAPTLGKYVVITREWGVRSSGKWVRQVGRTSSHDFVMWEKTEVVMEGLDAYHQTYAMPIFDHGGVYLGLVAIHDQEEDRVWTELTWSPDTIEWHRVLPGTPLIRNDGQEGDYDWGCAYPAAYPVFLEDEIRLYYGASDGLHTSWRNGFLAMATLRPDGFAGYTQEDAGKPATITTSPLSPTGGTLRISADVEQGGSVKVSVLAERNEVLAKSEPLTGSRSDADISWPDGFSFDELGSESIQLRFEFTDATIYSFSFPEKRRIPESPESRARGKK